MESMFVIKRVISSANWVNLIPESPIIILWILGFSLVHIAKCSTDMINKYGEMGHPCLTPHWGLNHSEISPDDSDLMLSCQILRKLFK